MVNSLHVTKMSSTRLPTEQGVFRLNLYHNNWDDKEHLALVMGEVQGREDVLVRVHSECYTGDVLHSLRCDCGEQLHRSLEMIATKGSGILIYLRQEGRGIGLLNKLRAYNLQDEGYDTVEANLMLGHQADERDYSVAGLILHDLGVHSISLITNNPDKLESLQSLGVVVNSRVWLPSTVHHENAAYLAAKVTRMRHLLQLEHVPASLLSSANGYSTELISKLFPKPPLPHRPFVTLSYAQSLDGCLTTEPGKPFAISGAESLRLTHQLRAVHAAILVGIGTVLADDPRLSVRLVAGVNPQPVVVDSHLRFPLTARLLAGEHRPIVATTEAASAERERGLVEVGARVVRVPAFSDGRVNLVALLQWLHQAGYPSLMVEGGAGIITSFLHQQLADRLVLTIAPLFLGGLTAVHQQLPTIPRLQHSYTHPLGKDTILWGEFAQAMGE